MRLLNKLKKEYEELDDESTPLKDFKKAKQLSRQQFDELNPIVFSMLHFQSVFGGENLARVIGQLLDLSGNDEAESYIRVAHFFYHLGRRHERAFFK